MMLLVSILVFLLIAVIFAWLGTHLWARPKAAIDRVTGAAVEMRTVAHPSLAWRELVKKLGSIVPSAPKDSTIMLRRLMRAGFRSPGALKTLYGSKIVLAVLLPFAAVALTAKSDLSASNKALVIIGALAAGFFGPNEYVRHAAKRRQKRLRKGLPNALDLMVVCVESGLGLDQ